MKKITLLLILLTVNFGYSQNSVTVATSQAWNGYVAAFNVSDDAYAGFGFSYPAADLRATATTTSMTLEPNIAIWTAEAGNAAWFDQDATEQTAVLYIEANSYIEDNSLAGEALTFSGNVSVSDLGSGYTPVAFIKALDPNNGFATVVNNTVSISSTGDFTVSATAAELAAGYIIQYGFAVKGPLADPADNSLGSVVIGTEAPSTEPTTAATTPPTRDAADVISLYSDAYTAATTISNVPWDDSNYEEVSIAGDNVLKIAGVNFLGIDFGDYLDATDMTHLHMDYWIVDDWQAGQVLNPKLSNHAAQAGETNALDITNAIGSQAEVQNWQSKDFELTGDRESLKQFLITVAAKTDLYYLDNVYLYKDAPPASGNDVTVATSQAWNGYVAAFNVSDDAYAGFGFSYPAADLRATATTTSMTLEPNIAIWTAEAGNAAWFDQDATEQTAVLYIEANSYIEDNSLAGEALTFSGNVSVSDLGSGYTPVAFIKALDPNNGFATVVNNTVSISSTGDFTVSATAAELAAGYIIQYGFAVKGPLADPADNSLGSVVIGTEAPSTEPTTAATTPPTRDAADVISLYSDAYTAATTISNVPWDDSNYEEVSIAGDNVLKIAGVNFLGIDFGDYLDATDMTHLHMDYWIVDDWQAGQVLNPKLSNHAAQAGETNALDITNAIGSQAEVQNWQSKDFELTGDRESLKQFLITVAAKTDLYYLDNVYLYKDAPPASGNDVTVATSQAWNGYVAAFNVSDDAYAGFGFSYPAADLRATATTTSMTLEPNIAIWTAEAGNAAWFDQDATEQTAVLYIEANSYIEDNSLAGEALTFSGNVSVSDLGSGYTPVAFIKALDPNNGFATVVNNTVSISSTGDFTVSATAAELAAGYIIQYGFAVKGPLADPADNSLGSVVIGAETLRLEDTKFINVSVYPNPSSSNWNFRTPNTVIKSVEVFNLLGKRVASQRNNNSTEASISTQGLTNGIYIARITTEQGAKSVKLIKN